MNKKQLIFSIVIIISLIFFAIWYKTKDINYGTKFEFNDVFNEKDISILDTLTSPNGQYKFYEYQFDNGGLGYSRVFWSIININDKQNKIFENNLPDGYKIVGWDEKSVLILAKWEPYYASEESIELTETDYWKGFKIKIE